MFLTGFRGFQVFQCCFTIMRLMFMLLGSFEDVSVMAYLVVSFRVQSSLLSLWKVPPDFCSWYVPNKCPANNQPAMICGGKTPLFQREIPKLQRKTLLL